MGINTNVFLGVGRGNMLGRLCDFFNEEKKI